MSEALSSIAVIGIGGGGTEQVNDLRKTHPNSAQYVTLDVDAELFRGFFQGYLRDVYPPVQSWAIEAGVTVTDWFEVTGWYSPYTDLPDIFLRNTRRPVMRASLLMHRLKLSQHLQSVLTDPEVVILTARTGGSTGSAWIADIAYIVKELFPEVSIRIVLNDELSARSITDSHVELRGLTNSYWTCREISSDEFLKQCSILVESKAEVAALMFEYFARTDDDAKKNGAIEIQVRTEDLARRVYSKMNDLQSMNCDMYASARCYPLSKVVAKEELDALVGLLLLVAENRLTLLEDAEINCWSGIGIHTKQPDKLLTLTIPKVNLFGRNSIGLVLSHKYLGNEQHSVAYQLLVDEGCQALSIKAVAMRAETRENLEKIRNQIVEKLNIDSSGKSSNNRTQLFADIYPMVIRLVDKILINKG
jgi:hypothetical protein